jgi:hypothetical protein
MRDPVINMTGRYGRTATVFYLDYVYSGYSNVAKVFKEISRAQFTAMQPLPMQLLPMRM